MVVAPHSVEELAEAVRAADRVSGVAWSGLAGVVDFSPDDQVVTLLGGTDPRAVPELATAGQCLPWAPIHDADFLADALAWNLPHALEGSCGSWRDWVLGGRAVLADGTIVKLGAKVVKNVAGYDLQKLFLGGGHAFGFLAEVTLRTLPIGARPEPRVERRSELAPVAVQRVLPADANALAASRGIALFDPLTGTAWLFDPDAVPRFSGDWRRPLPPAHPLEGVENPVARSLFARAKSLFDPDHKLPWSALPDSPA